MGVLSKSLGPIQHSQSASLFFEAAGYYATQKQEVQP